VRVNPGSGMLRASFEVAGSAERLLCVGSKLWLIGSRFGSGARLWPVNNPEGLGRPISVRLPFGGLLIGADERRIAIMNTGQTPRLRIVDTRTRRVRSVRYGGSYAHGLVIRGDALWVASEPGRIDVLDLGGGGVIVASGSFRHSFSGLFLAEGSVGAVTPRQVVFFSASE